MSTAKKKDLNSLGSIYGDILNNVKHKIIKESKVKEGEIGEVPLIKGGPQETSGYMTSKLDKRKMSKKELDDNLYKIKDLSNNDEREKTEEDEEEFSEENKKIARKSINNFMSKKSIFDKLYENVMFGGEQDEAQELDSLGLDDSTPDEEQGSEDEVTITLDRETAMKLYEILGACCGEGSEGEGEGEGEDEGMGEEGEYNNFDEDEESLGGASTFSKSVDFGKNNKVGNVKPVGGSASSDVTDKVGNDGDHGHALVNAKQPNVGKNNKVGNLKTGQGAFQR